MAKVNQRAMSIVLIHWKHDSLMDEPKLNWKPLMNSLVDEAQPTELSLGSIHPCS
jgi:hypothetical protein